MSIKLDSYEQDIEDNFEKQQKIDDRSEIALLQKICKAHLSKKRSVTIRLQNMT